MLKKEQDITSIHSFIFKTFFLIILSISIFCNIVITNAADAKGNLNTNSKTQHSRASTSGEWIQSSNGKWWYKHTDGSYTQDDWEYINGEWYYFDSDGWMVTGWLWLDGKCYYLNSSGAMVTGWNNIDGKKYYFNASGEMQTGWIQPSYYWYYLGSDGAMVTGWLWYGGGWYYLNTSSGAMVTGWKTIEGTEYYFYPSSGIMATGSFTEYVDNDTITHYFQSNGAYRYTVSLWAWDLVDETKHLEWRCFSNHLAEVEEATEIWNAYKSGVIRNSNNYSIDVYISDINEKSNAIGITYSNGYIQFNDYHLNGEYTTTSLSVAIHEFGHALGLGHSRSGDVMCSGCQNTIVLSTSDKRSYDSAYSRY